MIITTNEKLPHYIQLLTHQVSIALVYSRLILQVPIESKFIDRLADHLNAEIVLGTVATMKDAVIWLSYTYLYIRYCNSLACLTVLQNVEEPLSLRLHNSR